MISISKEDLQSMECLGSGLFGTVYRKDANTAFKIYHTQLYDPYGKMVENPALRFCQARLDRLKHRGRNLQYTDVWQDKIYMDHKFAGLSFPCYDGDLLFQLMHQPYDVKMRLAKEYVRNSKELTSHGIYPMDYKLNNVMTNAGEVKILDLDDFHTKVPIVPTPFHKSACVFGLHETLLSFFEEYDYASYGIAVRNELMRKRTYAEGNYRAIEQYLSSKEEPIKFLFIDSESDIKTLQNILTEEDYQVIYTFPRMILRDDDFLLLIDHYSTFDISLYDILFLCYRDLYLNNFHMTEGYELHEKQLIKIK